MIPATLPQIVRLITELDPNETMFTGRWNAHLDRLAAALASFRGPDACLTPGARASSDRHRSPTDTIRSRIQRYRRPRNAANVFHTQGRLGLEPRALGLNCFCSHIGASGRLKTVVTGPIRLERRRIGPRPAVDSALTWTRQWRPRLPVEFSLGDARALRNVAGHGSSPWHQMAAESDHPEVLHRPSWAPSTLSN